MSADLTLIMTTVATPEQAKALATSLLASKLAACVQVQAIQSHYVWRDERCEEAEQLLLIKTRAALYAQVEQHLLGHHPYDTPEIVQVPIMAGSSAFAAWVVQSTT
jgi:periplasmic divalent cation tolerance protein